MADEKRRIKTGKDAKYMGEMAGCPEIVDARPDLASHLETHLSTISTPNLTNPEDSDASSRGILPNPPADKMGGVHAWKPKGRK